MMQPLPSRRIVQGFTLIEVMVALAITALVMTLLMSATFYMLQIRSKLGEEVQQGEQVARREAWFRQIIGSIQPLEDEAPDPFEADASGFRALVSRPLRAQALVAPEQIELRIVADDQGATLVYKVDKVETVLANWPRAAARFAYLNRAGKIETSWNTLLQPTERIPRAIQIEITSKDGGRPLDYWFARIDADPWRYKKTLPPFLLPGAGGS
ncbi:type II secretion system protein [Chitinimonas arctica]|uniref:Type II secretion system protein n=1 Tax=Chitinimonas arctica TaxID=2594795 RepID=A0A516SGG1_9NEIS|nr:type II secretion system protein [Chitinimonas arctica]QDQ27245.1 type II secretion system protein [Chitinimonas arctica]